MLACRARMALEGPAGAVVVSAAGRAGPRAALARLAVAAGPDFTLFGAFTLAFLGIAFVYGAKFTYFESSIFGCLIAAAGLVGATAAAHARGLVARDPAAVALFTRRCREVLRDFGPFFGVIVVYEHLYLYTGLIRPDRIDAHLIAADIALFGVEPTLWIQQFVTPWRTELFAIAYNAYFPMPLLLCLLLQARGRREDFRELVTAITCAMYLGFLGYLFFPAGPPRFYEPILAQFDPPTLRGALGFFEQTQVVWDSANQVKVSASFPSMHCALSMLSVLYALRFGDVLPRRKRLLFGSFLCVSAVLWTSTVYLRHHWVVDMFAGWTVAATARLVAPRLRALWARLA
jgi:membrane-associated phospholipid phosphatase